MKFPITSDRSIVISGILLAQTLVPRRVSSQYRVGPVRSLRIRSRSVSTVIWLALVRNDNENLGERG